MALRILAVASAAPTHSLDQQAIAESVLPLSADSSEQERILKVLYRRTSIRARGSVLVDEIDGQAEYDFYRPRSGPTDQGPSTEARMCKYERHALPLALRAASEALRRSGVRPGDITHLINVSCTGFYAPGIDCELVEGLSLERTVERLQIGFMGCHALLNALRTSAAIAAADPDARILLTSLELCSLHFQYGWNPEQVVSNSLFADGAGALVVGGRRERGAGGGERCDPWNMTSGGSYLLPDSADAMTWRVGDHGFQMTLSPEIPGLIETHLAAYVDRWLAPSGLTRDDIATWAIHPGGPRILDAAETALGLTRESTAVSREVLSNHGNMSSATMTFILERLLDSGAPLPCVALGFGPGVTIEATLFE